MSIEILPDDLTSSAALGQSVLSQLATITQQHLGKTAVEVLKSTPKAKLVVNPGRTERQKNMRSMVRKVKKSIQVAMDDMNLKTVMANRKSLTR